MRFLVLIAFLLAISCRNGGEVPQTKENNKSSFPYPQQPAMVGSAAFYLTKNFWKEYAKKPIELDSLQWKEVVINYFNVAAASGSHLKLMHNAMHIADSLYAAGSREMFLNLMKHGEKLLYDPNSPYLNEELYIPILQGIVESSSIAEEDKISYRYQLEMSLKNRIGTTAADLQYTTVAGARGYIHKIDTDYIILFFNNPDCAACKEILRQLKEAPLTERLINEKRLTILAIYIDQDLERWRANMDLYPKNWIYARDHRQEVNLNRVYCVRAIPSLYLLNREKRVLIKDAPDARPILTAMMQ